MSDFLDMSMMGMFPATGLSSPNMGNSMTRQMQQMRAMRYLRPYSQGVHASRGTPRQNPFMMPQGTSGLDAFTYDPQLHQQAVDALAPYGQRPLNPDEVNPYAVIPNNPFFQQHQRLGGFLDNFATGLANTQGGDTWGESLSNIARGVIQGKQMHQQMLEQQFAAPFQRAQMLEGMAATQQKIDTDAAHEAYWNAMADKAMNPVAKPGKFAGFYNSGGRRIGVMQPDADNPTGQEVDVGAVDTKSSPMPGMNGLVPDLKAMGVDPTTATPAQIQQAIDRKQKRQVQIMGAGASARTNAALNARATNPNAPALPEPPEVKAERASMENDVKTLSSAAYRKQAMQSIIQDQIAAGQPIKIPSSADIDKHVKDKITARKKQFNDYFDAYSANNPKSNTPSRVVNYNPETDGFEPVAPDTEDDE